MLVVPGGTRTSSVVMEREDIKELLKNEGIVNLDFTPRINNSMSNLSYEFSDYTLIDQFYYTDS